MLKEFSELETVPVVESVPDNAAIDVPCIVLSCPDNDVTLHWIAVLNELFKSVIWLLNDSVAILKKECLVMKPYL